jgi:lipoteichoic acid synthase
MISLLYLGFLTLVTLGPEKNNIALLTGCILDAYLVYYASLFARQSGLKISLLLPLLLGVIYITQLYSVYLVGGYLSRLAIENAQTAYTTDFKHTALLIAIFIFPVVLAIDNIRKKTPSRREKGYFYGALALSAVIFPITPNANNFEVKAFESPLRSFVISILEYSTSQSKAINVNPLDLSQLKRDSVYLKRNELLKYSDKNVLVIFSEGFSARWMHAYGGNHPDLTPNLNALYEESFAVDNYWNHTAATFRGLRGQLTSGFQRLGGFHADGVGIAQMAGDIEAGINWLNPIRKLSKQGYKTYFYLSQENNLNKMLKSVGFDSVYGRDYISATYIKKPVEKNVLTDEQLLQSTLESLAKKSAEGERFFAAVYNFDTHNGLNSDIPYGNGKNEVLNRIKKFDLLMGRFIEDFKKSSLHENTLLVFTSDHATFPDIHARMADGSIPNIFVDRIPLLIYQKNIQPKKFDAGGVTSIALMPTLFDILGLENYSNMMVGCSIFETCFGNRLVSIGDESWVISNGRPEPLSNDSNDHNKARSIINSSKKLLEFRSSTSGK